MNNKNIVIFLFVSFGLLASFCVFAWTGPQNNPPGCASGQEGCDSPVNVGVTAQAKAGALTVLNLTTSGGKIYANVVGGEGDIERINILQGNNDLQLRSDVGNASGIYLGMAPSARIGFWIAGVEKFYIDASGNLKVVDGSIFTLGSRASDPVGWTTNGAMYYSTATGKLHCYQSGVWTDCGGSGSASVGVAGTAQFSNGAGGFNGDASNFFWDNTNKRLGIGAVAPSEKLQVVGNIKLGATGGSGDIKDLSWLVGYNDLFIKGNSSEAAPIYYGASQHIFYTNTTERMRIDNSGNVGIGTGVGVPAAKLEVAGGAIKATGGLIMQIIPNNSVAEPATVGSIWMCTDQPGNNATNFDCI